jgi:very-short-patch-repair endonuclease
MREANKIKTTRARRLRKMATNAENALWHRLRSRALSGYKFLRQEPIGPYTVDLICRERRLIIEIDGGQHADNPHDDVRDKWLVDHNYRILRFWNNDELGNIDGVLQTMAPRHWLWRPLTRIAPDDASHRRKRSDLSPHAGRGEARRR